VVTDFDVHWSWVQKSLDEYFVADNEISARLVNRGIAREHIHVTGIPVCPVFSRTYDSAACKTSLGLQPDKPTVLLMAGGFGVTKIDDTARRLLSHASHLQLIGIAGRNQQLYASLEKVTKEFPGRFVPVGFTGEVEKYMAASDIVISKPGGLTTSECLALGKPLIIVDPIPGQEEHNATYLLEHGAGVLAYDEVGVIYKLDKIMSKPGKLAQMQDAAKAIGKPNAGFDVADYVVKHYLS
jgi:processive 1,2-diacylglycerol beta-glucosyltransferase